MAEAKKNGHRKCNVKKGVKGYQVVPVEQRFFEKVIKTDSCWIWIGANDGRGYGIFWINGKDKRATHASLEIHGRQVEKGMVVCHKCDNPRCVNPDHLFAGTMKENMVDSLLKKRHWKFSKQETVKFGEEHPNSKLTEADVLSILNLSKTLSREELARKYNVSKTTIGYIVRGKAWVSVYKKWLPGEEVVEVKHERSEDKTK